MNNKVKNGTRKRKSRKLSQKIIVWALMLSTLSAAVIGIFSHTIYKGDMIRAYAKRATEIAETITVNIDGDAVEEYDHTGVKDDYYSSLVGYLSRVKALLDVEYIYVMTHPDTEYKYIAEGSRDGETNIADLGDTDAQDEYGPEPLEVLADGTVQASEIYDGGEGYGDLISAFAPVRNSNGKVVAVLGIDLNPETIEEGISGYLVVLLIITAASLVLTFLLLYFIIRRIVTRRIVKLEEAAQKLALGEVNIDLVDNQNDEIGSLFVSFSEMAERIRAKAEAAEKLAAGNMDIELHAASDKDVLAISMSTMIQTLKSFSLELTNVIRATSNGDFSVRGNVGQFREQYEEMVRGLNAILETSENAIRSIEETAAVADKRNRYQTEEVEKLNVNIHKLAVGDLDYSGHAADADSDISDLYEQFESITESLQISTQTIKGYILEVTRVLSGMSEGDMAQEINSEYKGAFIQLKNSINMIAGSMNRMLLQINNTAEKVAAGTKRVTDNAVRANELSENARKYAAAGNEQMTEMLRSIGAINDSSRDISTIIKVIDDIAFQTNILALNAAVEAARAGQHGKGFAVVAEEVRNLAAKSAEAAKKTAQLIENSVKNVESGTRIARDTASALDEIAESINQVSLLVEEIASEADGAIDDRLCNQADELKKLVSQFKLRSGNLAC